jgi:hypothetical protein
MSKELGPDINVQIPHARKNCLSKEENITADFAV